MNTEDRELLDLAAKAAGYQPWGSDCEGKPIFVVGGFPVGWNPLEDDGDALRLAVRLCMNVEITDSFVFACSIGNFSEPAKPCRDAAVRRAIVRAAAEIGKAMP